MVYTSDELDEALAESVGPRMWAAVQGAHNRVMTVDRATSARFWSSTPEDANSAVLRAAHTDLCHTDAFQFADDSEEEEDDIP